MVGQGWGRAGRGEENMQCLKKCISNIINAFIHVINYILKFQTTIKCGYEFFKTF